LDIVDVDRVVGKRRCVIDCKSELLKSAVVELLDPDDMFAGFKADQVETVDVGTCPIIEYILEDACYWVAELFIIYEYQDTFGISRTRFSPAQADDIAGFPAAILSEEHSLGIFAGGTRIVELHGGKLRHVRAAAISSPFLHSEKDLALFSGKGSQGERWASGKHPRAGRHKAIPG
jgi:hypothetical protein